MVVGVKSPRGDYPRYRDRQSEVGEGAQGELGETSPVPLAEDFNNREGVARAKLLSETGEGGCQRYAVRERSLTQSRARGT